MVCLSSVSAVGVRDRRVDGAGSHFGAHVPPPLSTVLNAVLAEFAEPAGRSTHRRAGGCPTAPGAHALHGRPMAGRLFAERRLPVRRDCGRHAGGQSAEGLRLGAARGLARIRRWRRLVLAATEPSGARVRHAIARRTRPRARSRCCGHGQRLRGQRTFGASAVLQWSTHRLLSMALRLAIAGT